MKVEVVYPLPHEQKLYVVDVAPGAKVKTALEQSGLLHDYPELDIEQLTLGIFSQKAGLDDRLRAFDRVEVYRPLTRDPKDRRRLKAKKG